MRLQGKVALVTGAGRGLGWGIARALGQAGARVCISDITEDELARSFADLSSDGSEGMSHHLDVSDLAEFRSVVDKIMARWGRLDIVVQNATFMPLTLFEDLSPEIWWRQLQVSLGGVFNAVRSSWDIMKAQGGGHVMGIASGSSIRGYKNEVAYCTGKHGQEGMFKALALESAPYKIALNTMGPGKPIKTTRITWAELDALPAEDQARWADPVELGKGFAWLASQPPERFSGLRFDAGLISDAIAREGWDFEFAPEKVTMYVQDFVERQKWMANYKD
jgi:NAD(P)-dependent dehydrogenase (short-subunit alcohol dehydrogenase family)